MLRERNRTPLGWTTLACLSLIIAGCPNENGNGVDCRANLLAGDLVITEIMANPDGTDDGKEWFEIYNRTSSTVDLTGVMLEAARPDGTGDEFHIVVGADIEAGQYLVLGGMLEEVKPDFVNYTYAADLGGLRNAGGQITLFCGEAQVDRVVYLEMSDGTSQSFDGTQTPDAIANDNLDDWCDSELEFEPDSFGTPGTANEACEGDLPPTSCRDGEQVRDVVGPQPGDLVITEFLPNPAAVDDAAGEWFEVYVGRDLDLNGLKLGKTVEVTDDQVASLDCVRVTAGSFLVFARSEDPVINGGLPAVDQVFDFTLGNTSGGLYLAYGAQLLDGITYSSSYTGASTSLEPTLMTPDANDNEDYWCEATDVYGAGDMGTPGTVNPSCGISPAGECYDQGALRAVRAPGPGDLVITEIMPNPSAVPDADGEWFEVYAAADLDLNWLHVGEDPLDMPPTLPGGDCLPVSAGSFLVFAASDLPGLNGGLPQVDFLFDFGLGNTAGPLVLGYEGVLLDQVNWTSSYTGSSTALDPSLTDPVLNDDPAYWCEATDPYGDGDLGTPGAANASCGVAPEGQCYENDVLRNKVEPVIGDLVITEFMANPDAVADADGEWFEVYVGRDVDLNGLQLGDDLANPDDTLSEGVCLRATAGSYVLFARSGDPALNGDLLQVDHVFGFGLGNSASTLSVGLEGAALDTITWGSVGTGAATSLDPGSLDPVANDDPLNWCPAVDPYGDGDLGTPRAANPTCP